MKVVFRSKRECYAICIGITLMVWAALTVALFMFLSLRHGGLLLVHFNLYNELWIELPLAVGIAIFSLWFMWTVAKKSKVGQYKMWTNATGSGYWNDPGNWDPPGVPHIRCLITEDALIREWDNKYDEEWDIDD